ncbi:MAG TPA: ferredoxin [Galbitalea sp.]|jgi:Ni,Fe-hydrogenase III small subunit/ferredoxin|nr:ferredoxin [Galbitalea sp.]
MPWVPRGLRNGVLTSRWPRHQDDYFDGFAAAIAVDPTGAAASDPRVAEAARACPTDAITATGDGVRLDRGRCILCGRCAEIAPEVFTIATGSAVAAVARDGLVVGRVAETDEALAAVRAELAQRVKRLRRSVHIRHVDAGSDGSDEWEVQALVNPVYDIHRLGIFFTASPRHADILLVTGIGTSGMRQPLRRTREAMPEPVVVIAAGTDATSGGLVGGGYTAGTGVGAVLDVDVWVPGSPASPFSLLHGILLALGRVPPPRDEGGTK